MYVWAVPWYNVILALVYEGVKSFYKEEDESVPVNVYGRSKLAAENLISEKCSNFAILRSSIIFGPQTASPVPKSLPVQVCWAIAALLCALLCFLVMCQTTFESVKGTIIQLRIL